MIRKFRKKPIIQDAIEFDGTNYKEIEKFMNQEVEIAKESETILVPTKEGKVNAPIGHFIFKGESPALGVHFWPVAPDYVENNYEEILSL